MLIYFVAALPLFHVAAFLSLFSCHACLSLAAMLTRADIVAAA